MDFALKGFQARSPQRREGPPGECSSVVFWAAEPVFWLAALDASDPKRSFAVKGASAESALTAARRIAAVGHCPNDP